MNTNIDMYVYVIIARTGKYDLLYHTKRTLSPTALDRNGATDCTKESMKRKGKEKKGKAARQLSPPARTSADRIAILVC